MIRGGPGDSRQLAELRYRYKAAHKESATALRLGTYARDIGMTVTDFGKHSARWIRLFKQSHDWRRLKP